MQIMFNLNIISNDDRVKYYLKNIYNDKTYVDENLYNDINYVCSESTLSKQSKPFHGKTYKLTYDELDDNLLNKKNAYLDDIPSIEYKESLKNVIKDVITDAQKTKNILFCPGDKYAINKHRGAIAKSRNINDMYSVLLKLNTNRHWEPIKEVKTHDIPYDQKDDKLVWRGSTTGTDEHDMRTILVQKFYSCKNKNIDIGYSNIVQNKNDLKKHVKGKKTMKELLKSKFIISIEGNDVASGLKWQMSSNSIVFMNKPRVTSWFMEDKLVPGVHYVLIKDDYSDLEEKHEWAINHPKECKIIVNNANEYVSQFMDEDNEQLITKKIMNIYFKNVIFVDNFETIQLNKNMTYTDKIMKQIFDHNEKNKSEHIIPKVLYKTGIEKYNELTPTMLKLFASIKYDNPEIKIVYFSNDGCRRFIFKHFGDNVLDAFDALLPGSYKADLFRYCVLYINGGIYGDLTQTYKYPFNKVIDYTKELFLTKDRIFGYADYGIQISFIACKPKLNIFRNAISQIINNINSNYYGLTSLDPTGPRLFKLCFMKEKHNIDYQMILEEKGDKIIFINEKSKCVNKSQIFIINKLPDVDKILKRNRKMHYSSRWKNRDIYLKERLYITNVVNVL